MVRVGYRGDFMATPFQEYPNRASLEIGRHLYSPASAPVIRGRCTAAPFPPRKLLSRLSRSLRLDTAGRVKSEVSTGKTNTPRRVESRLWKMNRADNSIIHRCWHKLTVALKFGERRALLGGSQLSAVHYVIRLYTLPRCSSKRRM